MGKRGPKPKTSIRTDWRPELAYAVGLIASDGCLSSDGRHIDLTSKDVDQLETFRRILGIEHITIGRKTSGSTSGKRYHHVQFGSVLFYQWLLSIGLTPRKSKTIGPLAIPDEFFFDFLRGLFDGDGTLYAFWDTRWASSFVYWLSFASASPIFVHWLQEECFRLAGVRGVVRNGKRVQELRFAKGATKMLVARMYHSKDVPRLSRKFAKIQNTFTIDGIRIHAQVS